MPPRHALGFTGAESAPQSSTRPQVPNLDAVCRTWAKFFLSLTADTLASQADVLVGFAIDLAGPGPVRGRIEARAR